MISCIIPAAGTSSRMGAWKILLPLQGIPIIFHSIEALLPLDVPITVVTGYRGIQLESIIRSEYPQVQLVRNSDYELGMYGSVCRGLAGISVDSDALILPADMPLLTADHIRPLISLWNAKQVLRPACEGKPGHPVLISAQVVRRALEQPGLDSMHQLIGEYTISYFETDDPAYITDADTPEAYRHLRS